MDEKSIENGLEGQKFLVVCLFWGGCHHPNISIFLFRTTTCLVWLPLGNSDTSQNFIYKSIYKMFYTCILFKVVKLDYKDDVKRPGTLLLCCLKLKYIFPAFTTPRANVTEPLTEGERILLVCSCHKVIRKAVKENEFQLIIENKMIFAAQ